MSTPAARALRRDPAHGILGGVCAGLARQFGVDPLVVRVAFVATSFAGGLGLAVYALAWALPPADEGTAALGRAGLAGRGALEGGLGVGLLVLSALLTFRALGIWSSDAVVWPLVLVAAGGALLWRETIGRPDEAAPERASEPAPEPEPRAAIASRTGLGVALVVAAGIAFLAATGALSAARDVVLSVLVVAAVLAIIFAPWVVRLARSLTVERAERVRSQERAEMAAHLHDSVLQTLALVQQRADDPRSVATLARRQERELRAWLSQRAAPGTGSRLGPAVEGAAGEVERDHGVPVEVVAVGDAELDERGVALVAAAREAMVNAAKFGGGSTVDVYAEVDDGSIEVFVRDRGPGFDVDAVPADRRGVRESIVGRMARHGGRAAVRSAPGEGTEVELALPL